MKGNMRAGNAPTPKGSKEKTEFELMRKESKLKCLITKVNKDKKLSLPQSNFISIFLLF